MAVSSRAALAQTSGQLDLLESIHGEITRKLPGMRAEVQEIKARLEARGRGSSVRSVLSGKDPQWLTTRTVAVDGTRSHPTRLMCATHQLKASMWGIGARVVLTC